MAPYGCLPCSLSAWYVTRRDVLSSFLFLNDFLRRLLTCSLVTASLALVTLTFELTAMDPLSIAVAVVGLLGSAEAVRRKLSQFTRSATSAPSIAETVLIEVSSIETALPRLRRFIEDDRVSTREHIYLDQLSTLLTGCVKRFSELETLLGGLPSITAAETSRIDAARWAQNEKRIRIVVERLQPYKSSLLLMLQIIEL